MRIGPHQGDCKDKQELYKLRIPLGHSALSRPDGPLTNGPFHSMTMLTSPAILPLYLRCTFWSSFPVLLTWAKEMCASPMMSSLHNLFLFFMVIQSSVSVTFWKLNRWLKTGFLPPSADTAQQTRSWVTVLKRSRKNSKWWAVMHGTV